MAYPTASSKGQVDLGGGYARPMKLVNWPMFFDTQYQTISHWIDEWEDYGWEDYGWEDYGWEDYGIRGFYKKHDGATHTYNLKDVERFKELINK